MLRFDFYGLECLVDLSRPFGNSRQHGSDQGGRNAIGRFGSRLAHSYMGRLIVILFFEEHAGHDPAPADKLNRLNAEKLPSHLTIDISLVASVADFPAVFRCHVLEQHERHLRRDLQIQLLPCLDPLFFFRLYTGMMADMDDTVDFTEPQLTRPRKLRLTVQTR